MDKPRIRWVEEHGHWFVFGIDSKRVPGYPTWEEAMGVALQFARVSRMFEPKPVTIGWER